MLRQEMSNTDPQIAIYALMGISRVATSDDVHKIVSIGLRRSLLANVAVASLTFICLPEARVAIEELQSAYAGKSEGKRIKALLDSQGKGCTSNSCCGRVNIAMEPKY